MNGNTGFINTGAGCYFDQTSYYTIAGQTCDTMYIDQPSYLKLNMHKTTPANATDTVFETRHFLTQNSTYNSNLPLRRGQIGQTNISITDTFSYKRTPRVAIEWRHYNHGLIQMGRDTINLVPNSLTQHSINY